MQPLHLIAFALAFTLGIAASPAFADNSVLPEREGPRPKTTLSVPHVQIGVERVPKLHAELLRRVASLPGVDVRPTVISLPGAQGFWLERQVTLARPEVIVGGREFAHVHPDGSLHASLEPRRAREAVAAGWAVPHPWANRRSGWEGFVMLYTPLSEDELDVTFQLVLDSYNFVTGQKIQSKG